MTDSNATSNRNILVNIPDYPTSQVKFRLLTEYAAAGDEGFPQLEYVLTLSGGAGTQVLPVPSSDAWAWRVTLPDGNIHGDDGTLTLAAGADLQLNTWLVSAQSTETAASLADYFQPLDAGLTDISGLAVTDVNIIVGDGSNWVAESGATARSPTVWIRIEPRAYRLTRYSAICTRA